MPASPASSLVLPGSFLPVLLRTLIELYAVISAPLPLFSFVVFKWTDMNWMGVGMWGWLSGRSACCASLRTWTPLMPVSDGGGETAPPPLMQQVRMAPERNPTVDPKDAKPSQPK